MREACPGPWAVGGDFNLIYQAEDKNNANLDRAMMGRFRCFLNDMSLQELPLLGRKFTWSNEREAPTLVRLDRVFVTTDWEQAFPDCLLQSSTSMISDHCPLLLGLQDLCQGKRRFHFESYWPKLDGFLEEVSCSWNQPVQATCPLQHLADKLGRLARDLQSWSERRVGHIKQQLNMAKEVLHRLEIAQDSRALSLQEEWLRRRLKRHALGLASLERTMARMRSRLNWLKEGDANTSYFQQHARYRKRKNFIAKLRVDDQVIIEQDEKKNVVWDFYNKLLSTAWSREFSLDLQSFHQPAMDLFELDQIITEEEIWATVKSLPADKAPGPDGYTGKFYKVSWQVIKADFMAAVSRIMQGDVSTLTRLTSR